MQRNGPKFALPTTETLILILFYFIQFCATQGVDIFAAVDEHSAYDLLDIALIFNSVELLDIFSSLKSRNFLGLLNERSMRKRAIAGPPIPFSILIEDLVNSAAQFCCSHAVIDFIYQMKSKPIDQADIPRNYSRKHLKLDPTQVPSHLPQPTTHLFNHSTKSQPSKKRSRSTTTSPYESDSDLLES
jgi:hypothetical protein